MRWERLVELGRELPGVGEGTWYRTPGLHVCGKFFCRLKEDGRSVVFRLESVEEQEFLVAAQPDVYFVTDHYRGYAAVLARLDALRVDECRQRLASAWRLKAPRGLLRQRETSTTASADARRRPLPARRPGVSATDPGRRPRRSPRRRPVRRRPSSGR